MKQAVDTNVLIYAHLPAFEQHPVAHKALLELLRSTTRRLVITPLILHEFVHVVTDPRRFDVPATMPEALALARSYLGRSNIDCLATDEQSVGLAVDLMQKHQLGRRRMADTLLAATLIRHGVPELLTFNAKDFTPFQDLQTIVPS